VAYQFQVIARVLTDVLHDVAVGHPFGDHREPPILTLKGVRNTDEIEDVGVCYVLPRGDFFTELLYGVSASLDEKR